MTCSSKSWVQKKVKGPPSLEPHFCIPVWLGLSIDRGHAGTPIEAILLLIAASMSEVKLGNSSTELRYLFQFTQPFMQ